MPHVLVAFDKFRGALSASQAGAIAAQAIAATQPSWTAEVVALSDGGEGFCEALTGAAGGELHSLPCHDPLGRPIAATVGVVETSAVPARALARFGGEGSRRPSRLMVVEMAQASGLALLAPAERDVWQCTSRGTGELLAQASRLQADHILLGVGGSASSDLGLGALSALGFRFLDSKGEAVEPPCPEAWSRIVEIEGAPLPGLPAVSVACDVTNPLLGAQGAAAVYGPQKGLQRADLARHEARARPLAQLLLEATGSGCTDHEALLVAPGAGAAGGLAFGLMAALDAQLVPGFSLISDWLNLPARIAEADWVLTGEGRFDASSLCGKATGSVLAACAEQQRTCQVFAGSVAASQRRIARAISPTSLPLDEALTQSEVNLYEAVRRWCLELPGEAPGTGSY